MRQDQALNRARRLYQSGRLQEAYPLVREVVATDPGNAPALRILGVIAHRLGEAPEAVGHLVDAVKADPDGDVNWTTLADALGTTPDLSGVPLEALEPILEALLRHESVGSRDLSAVLALHFRRVPGVGELLALNDAAAVEERLAAPGGFDPLLTTPTLCPALELTVVPELGFERLVQAARRVLLLALARGEADHPGLRELPLVCALARHCFLSGYIHPSAPDEWEALEGVVRAMAGRPLGEDPLDPARIALLGAYRPLGEWERDQEVVHLAGALDSRDFTQVVKQQILDPATEARFRDAIPVLSTVEDETSVTVRRMYETHPYPRWVRAPRLRGVPLVEHLRRQLPGMDFPELERVDRPSVLVAGCGTGLHPIETRQAVQGSRVVGMDISLSSLAYAARKVEEMGLDGLGFVHGDILALDAWDERFHLIESVGVLQHLRDPVAGLRALLGRLHPGGVIRLGLYSEVARQGITGIREELAEGVQVSADDEIREARQRAIDFLEDHPEGDAVLQWLDFFSLQEFRDLVLHPHEHRFTLPRLKSILEELELEFLGFGPLPGGAEHEFRTRHPEPSALRDLDAWDAFERDHPSLFRDLYRFWVRKRR